MNLCIFGKDVSTVGRIVQLHLACVIHIWNLEQSVRNSLRVEPDENHIHSSWIFLTQQVQSLDHCWLFDLGNTRVLCIVSVISKVVWEVLLVSEVNYLEKLWTRGSPVVLLPGEGTTTDRRWRPRVIGSKLGFRFRRLRGTIPSGQTLPVMGVNWKSRVDSSLRFRLPARLEFNIAKISRAFW